MSSLPKPMKIDKSKTSCVIFYKKLYVGKESRIGNMKSTEIDGVQSGSLVEVIYWLGHGIANIA